MPIYEFYCDKCNTLFNFFSRKAANKKVPGCPKCANEKLKKNLTTFATLSGGRKEEPEGLPSGLDDSKLEKAMGMLESEAGKIDENDPRQTVQLMRKFSDITGVNLGSKREDALRRIEGGEEPAQVEAEMGDLMSESDILGVDQRSRGRTRRSAPDRDETLYEL